jgi:hypothetical protein
MLRSTWTMAASANTVRANSPTNCEICECVRLV